GDIPDENAIRNRTEAIASIVSSHEGWESMTYDEKRTLVKMVFSGTDAINTQLEWEEATSRGEKPTPTERRMGVYIGWVPGEEKKRHKVFDYAIRGHLVSEDYRAPLDDYEKRYLANHYDSGEPLLQEELTNYASRSTSTSRLSDLEMACLSPPHIIPRPNRLPNIEHPSARRTQPGSHRCKQRRHLLWR
ncbi:MAG: hypothetical protein QGF00_06175, partial [Planctomycetota bacterium]|nr:hypothetical protein [Planctomycetota bacterium]